MGFGVGVKLDEKKVSQVKNEFNKLLKDMQAIADKNIIDIKVQNANNQINNMNKSLGQTNTHFKTLGASVQSIGKFFLKWYGTSQAILLVIREIKEGLEFINNMDIKASNISMITGMDKSQVQGYIKEWNNMAITLKTTTDAVVDSQEQFLRAGQSINDANRNTETNIKLSRIAGDSASETADSLIKLSNAYELNADQLEKYANMVAYLDSATATNTKALNQSVTYAAQAAQNTGTSLEFLLGMISTVQEKSKMGAEAIGRNFRSMFLNIQKIQTGKDIEGLSKLEDALNKQGIALRKSKKEWRDSELVMKDIMATWGKMDGVTKSTITQYLAGKEQAESFLTVMNNASRVQENYNNALGATNNLNDKYKEHLNSSQGAIDEMKSSMQKLYINTINGGFIISIAKATTILINFVDKIGVANIAIIGLTVHLIKMLTTTKVAETLGTWILGLTNVAASMTTLKLAIGGVTAIIGIVIAGFVALSNHLRKQREEAEALANEYKNVKKAIEEVNVEEQKMAYEELQKKQQKVFEMMQKVKDYSTDLNDTYGAGGMHAQDELNDYINDLEKAGYTINRMTGEIRELSIVTANMNVDKQIQDIKNQTEARAKEIDSIVGLMNRYNELDSIQNKSKDNQSEMSRIAQELQKSYKDLDIAMDSNGSYYIKNKKLISDKIVALNDEKGLIQTTAQIEIQSTQDRLVMNYEYTTITIGQARQRISVYQAEMESIMALNQAWNTKGMMDDNFDWAKYKKYKMLQNEIQKLQDKINSKVSDVYGNVPSYGGNSGNYTPKDGGKTGTSSNTKQNIEDISIETDRYYKLNNALNRVITSLDLLKQQESQMIENNRDKNNILEQEIDLLEQKKDLYVQLQQEQQKEALEGRQGLNLPGLRNFFKGTKINVTEGFQFDTKTAEILNMDLLEKLVSQANKLTGDAKKKAIDRVKEVETAVKNYNDLIKKLFGDTVVQLGSLDKEIADITQTIQDSVEKAARDYLEAQKKLDEAVLKQKEQQLKQDIEDLEKSIYGTTQEEYEKLAQNRIDAIKAQIDALEKSNDLEKESEERQKRLVEIQELKNKLANVQNEKNVQELTQKSDGTYDFTYVADQNEIDNIQKDISEKQQSLADWEQENTLKRQKESLEAQIRYEEKLMETKKLSYEQQKGALEEKLQKEKDAFDAHYADMDILVQQHMDTLKTTYGNKWDEIIVVIQEKLKVAESEYQRIMSVLASAQQAQAAISAMAGGGGVASGGRNYTPVRGSYAEGGTVDFTGFTAVHGSNVNAETIFNAKDSKKLYDLIHNVSATDIAKYMFKNINLNIPKFNQTANKQPTQQTYNVTLNCDNIRDGQDVIDTLKSLPRLVMQP